MPKIDTLLSIIENPTRRRILQELVREPHYPLQLSRELKISQQSIMKHLKVLEDNGLVRCYVEESDLGGPQRKRYVPTMNFTIIVDLGQGLFSTEVLERNGSGEPVEGAEEFLADAENLKGCINGLREMMEEIERELQSLHGRRMELIAMKERALEKARELVEERVDDYQLRKVLYEYINRPSLEPEQIAKRLSMRDDVVRSLIDQIRKEEVR